MAELVDAHGSGPCKINLMGVRLPLPAPDKQGILTKNLIGGEIMAKIKKYFYLLPLILFLFASIDSINITGNNYFNTSYATGTIDKSIKSDVSSKILLDYTNEKIKKNFEDVITEHEIIKILNKKGVNKYSTLSFPFSRKNRKLHIYFIKIFQPDGNVYNVNLNGLKTVTAPFNTEAPIFSNQLLKTIRLPELTDGSVINYKFKTTTVKPYMKDSFFTEDYFGGLSPLKKSVYRLTIPENVYYKYVEYGFNKKPSITENSGDMTLIWQTWNRKKIMPEQMGPSESFIVPHVTVSSIKSWNKVAAWYAGLTNDIIKPGRNLKYFIKKLIRSKKTKLQKTRVIYNFVAKKIRYVGYEFGIDGYKPSNVNSVFKNRFGDCKDHATLFASMLSMIGVKAYPVLIPTTEIPDMNPKLPTPFVFDHEITAIKLKNGKFMFADTTSNVTTFGDLPPMDQGRNVLIIINGKGVIAKTPIFPPKKNRIDMREYAALSYNGSIRSKITFVYAGAYDMYKRYLYSSESAQKKKNGILKKILNISPNAELSGFSFKNGNSLTKPFIEKISFSAKEYAGKKGNIMLVRLPIRTMTTLAKVTALNHRKYSLKFGYNFSEKNTIYLKFPKGYKPVFIPKDINIKNIAGSFKTYYVVKKNTVVFNSYFSTNGYEIPPENYLMVKRLFNKTIKTLSRQVLIFHNDRLTTKR